MKISVTLNVSLHFYFSPDFPPLRFPCSYSCPLPEDFCLWIVKHSNSFKKKKNQISKTLIQNELFIFHGKELLSTQAKNSVGTCYIAEISIPL